MKKKAIYRKAPGDWELPAVREECPYQGNRN